MITTRNTAIALCFAALAGATTMASAQDKMAPANASAMEQCMTKARMEADPAKRRAMETECGQHGNAMGSGAMGGAMQTQTGGAMSSGTMDTGKMGGSMDQMAPKK